MVGVILQLRCGVALGFKAVVLMARVNYSFANLLWSNRFAEFFPLLPSAVPWPRCCWRRPACATID